MAKSIQSAVPRPLRRIVKTVRRSLGVPSAPDLSPQQRAERIAALVKPLGPPGRAWAELFYEAEKLGVHVLPVGYYSPVPDTRELAANRHRWDRDSDLSVLAFNYEEQARLGEAFRAYRAEYASMPSAQQLRAKGLGQGYGEIEAMLLHAFLRHVKPARVIEVGSGVSTYYSAHALDLNRRDGRGGTITCIEPYPAEHLKAAEFAPRIIEKCGQDVEPEFFRQLDSGDVLFIDSSHSVKVGSDVNYLLLDVVPSLKPGVYIHIHDIPFPRITPREYWIFERALFWQEAVLLKALLTHNDRLEVIYCASYLYYKEPQALKETFPAFDPAKHFPSAIWLRKTA